MEGKNAHTLRLRRIGIDTYQQPVIYMRRDCHVCRSEGFEALSRVQVAHHNGHTIGAGGEALRRAESARRGSATAHPPSALAWKKASPSSRSTPRPLESWRMPSSMWRASRTFLRSRGRYETADFIIARK